MSDSAKSTLDLFAATGAYLRGHFRLSSGLHSDQFLQSARVLQYPSNAADLGSWLATVLAGHGPISVVASPALGGLIIGHEVARALGARHIFAERDAEGKMTLRRGFEVTADDRVAVVEDVMTTGGSIREVMEVIRANGAQVVAAGALIDRSGGAVSVGVPHHTLATLDATTWQPDRCPLCAAGQEVVKPGSRKS